MIAGPNPIATFAPREPKVQIGSPLILNTTEFLASETCKFALASITDPVPGLANIAASLRPSNAFGEFRRQRAVHGVAATLRRCFTRRHPLKERP